MFVYLAHCLLHLKGTADGALSCVRHHQGGAKQHEDGVPDDLIDSAAALMDKLYHGREVVVQQGHHLGGLKPFRQGGKPPQIGHQQGNLALLSPKFEPFGQVEEHPHDVVAGVAAEGLPDELIAALKLLIQIDKLLPGVLQLLSHGVEGNGEVSHEINPLLQITPGDLLGLPGKVLEVRLEGLEGMGNGHAAGHRANVQFPLGDLRHGFGEEGELHQEAIHIGKKLADLIVREVIRYRDGLRDLPGAKIMKRCGNLIKQFLFNRDHLETSFGFIAPRNRAPWCGRPFSY